MSTVSISTDELRAVPVVVPLPTSTALFFVVSLLLVTLSFRMPLNQAWKISTYENFSPEVSDVNENLVRNGSMSRQLGVASLGLFGLAVIAWPVGRKLHGWNWLGLCCLAYLGWSAASCLWTDDFSMSIRRYFALACELAAGIAIAKRLSVREFVWFIFACILSWFCLGLVAEISQGTFRPGKELYRFAGIFHPNDMGAELACLIMTTLYLARSSLRLRPLLYVIAALAFIFLLLTKSRTAVAALMIVSVLWWSISGSTTRMLIAALLLGTAGLFAAGVASVGSKDSLSELVMMGRKDDSETGTLTGRTPLWAELIEEHVNLRPLLGHGYGAFWTIDHIDEVSHTHYWQITNAHSSYIDLLLNLGWIGLSLCLLALFAALFKSVKLEARMPLAGYGLIGMLVLYVLVEGLTETVIGATMPMSMLCNCGICFLIFQDGQSSRFASRQPNGPSGNLGSTGKA
jgi:exopolysaccharide production protein ExoQ